MGGEGSRSGFFAGEKRVVIEQVCEPEQTESRAASGEELAPGDRRGFAARAEAGTELLS
jgi:hypothetical protein